jgi:hypothetical protein
LTARIFRTLAAVAVAGLATLASAATASAAPPANDNIANAQALTPGLPVSVEGTTVDATGEPGEKVFGNPANESVWYSWRATASGTVVVDICSKSPAGPEVSTGIGVYTGAGTTFASLTKVEDTTGPCKVRFTAVNGTTYEIQVDFLRNGHGAFQMSLHSPQPPANDDFAAAQNLGNALPFSVAGSTIEATFEAGEPDFLGKAGGSRSVWYSWTAPKTAHVQLGGCPFVTQPGSAANDAIGVFTGATLAALTNVVETNNCKVEFDAVAGTNYRIAFSGNFAGEGTFTLALHEAPPPSNDNFANAIALAPVLPTKVSGDNSFATTETGEGALPIGGFTGATHSVWYRWTPAVSQRVKLNACGTSGIPQLGVFTGTTIATLKVANLPLTFAPFCAAELNAVAGTTYSIAIAGNSFEGSTGPFELEIHAVSRPPNDNFAAATVLGPELPIAVDATNADATVETDEPSPGFFVNALATVWYRWESRFSGPVDVSTCGSPTADDAAVYTGSSLAKLTRIVPVGEEGEPGPCPSRAQKGSHDRFTAVAGTTYFIQVSGTRNGLEGRFHLTITDPNPRPVLTPPPPPAPMPMPTTTGNHHGKPSLKQAIARCRRHFRGKGAKAHAKRAACVKRAKAKFGHPKRVKR